MITTQLHRRGLWPLLSLLAGSRAGAFFLPGVCLWAPAKNAEPDQARIKVPLKMPISRIPRIDRRLPPLATAQAAQAAQAAHTARTIIKSRARTFALIPALLENIEPKLSILTPRQMAARAAKLFREEIAAPRWSGFSGDGPAMNIKAAAWYARYLRAKAAAGKRRTPERSRPLQARMP